MEVVELLGMDESLRSVEKYRQDDGLLHLRPRKPLKKAEDAEKLNDEHYLNPKRLKELSKCDDLSQITTLEMCIDSEKLFLGNFGEYVPNLRLLKIPNGIVPHGLENFKTLKELYLPFNEISDISACGLLECLEILDLEGNQIDDKRNVSFLSACNNLSNLTLEGNPIVKKFKSYSKYWVFVKAQLSTLMYLDGISTKSPGKLNVDYSREYNFEENWAYINSVLAEVGLGSQVPVEDAACSSMDVSNSDPPKETISPNKLFLKPVSGLHMTSSEKRLHLKVEDDGIIVDNLESSFQNTSEIEPLPQIDAGTTSRLTSGSVVCGDISKALRRRRHSMTPASPATPSTPPTSASLSRHPLMASLPPPRTPLESARSLEGVKVAVTREVTDSCSVQTPETSPRSCTVASSREADEEPACSADSELDCSTISASETEVKSGPVFSSIEKLQRDCAEALEELEAWRREFFRSPRKKSVRITNESSQRTLAGSKARGDTSSSLAEKVRSLIQNDGRPKGPSDSWNGIRKRPGLAVSATAASPIAEVESGVESGVQKSGIIRPSLGSRASARSCSEQGSSNTAVPNIPSVPKSKDSESPVIEPGMLRRNHQSAMSAVPPQRWQPAPVRPHVRPENTSASVAALRSRLASQFDPNISNGINAVIDRRTASQQSPLNGPRTQGPGKVAQPLGLKNSPGGDSSASASSTSSPVPVGPKIRLRNQPTLPSRHCVKQGNV
ncbi:Leucine-rich repeat-containing protein 56 [Sparganum proliferum]